MTQPVPLDALLRRLSRLAEQHFDHHGDIDPMWLVETADGEQKVIVSPIVVPNPLAGAEYKDRLAETMRETFRDMDVVRYAWAAECWIDSAYDPNETDEIISFEAEDSTELLWASREIIRPQHGKPYLGKLSEIERPTISGGRFRGLLPSAAHAQAAKEVPQEPADGKRKGLQNTQDGASSPTRDCGHCPGRPADGRNPYALFQCWPRRARVQGPFNTRCAVAPLARDLPHGRVPDEICTKRGSGEGPMSTT